MNTENLTHKEEEKLECRYANYFKILTFSKNIVIASLKLSLITAFPKQLRFERLMINHLVKKPTDFIGAFIRLPFKLQALFVQAYQSYLFNLFLSERLEKGLSLKKATYDPRK